MITIVSYGLGNTLAFVNLYKKLNIPCCVANNYNDLRNTTKIILPGVGSFDYAMEKLNNSGMRDTLDELIIEKKIPVLGICVGMQMLAENSEEGNLPGLGWIKGKVKKFKTSDLRENSGIPHMGWNNICVKRKENIFNDFKDNPKFYFLHSYYFEAFEEKNVMAVSSYGIDFCCAVNSSNVFGVQFHPEKSHESGCKLLKNFADI